MHPRLEAVLALLMALVWTNAAAQHKVAACTLLADADISTAVGVQVGAHRESDMVIPEGPSKGQTMAGCMWAVADQGMVAVSVAPLSSGAQLAAGLAALNQAFETAKAKGWKEEQSQDRGGVRCALMTPPASAPDAPNMTGCLGAAKGRGISVVLMSPTKKLPVAAAKALFDRVVPRLR